MRTKRKYNLFALSSLVVLTACTLITMAKNERPLQHTEAQCVNDKHNGNHYSANENGFVKTGNKEYWICCNCHQTFFSKPSTGSWVDYAKPNGLTSQSSAFLDSKGKFVNKKYCTGTLSNVSAPEGYAFKEVYEYTAAAWFAISENVDVSRYSKLSCAFKTETKYFVSQEPSWDKPFNANTWYIIEIRQTSNGVWDLYFGKAGSVLELHQGNISSNDLRSIIDLQSDPDKCYITEFFGEYKSVDKLGEKIDESLFTGNGYSVTAHNECIPGGFEQINKTETKKNSGDYFHGQFYSAVDVSSYNQVQFAIKTTGYFLFNHFWESGYINGSMDWMIFTLTKNSSSTWDLVINNYNGSVLYSENNLSGFKGSDSGVYTNYSLNAILYGCCNGFYASKNDSYDLVVYSTEIRASSTITLNNSYKLIYDSNDKNATKAADDLFYNWGRSTGYSLYLAPVAAGSETYNSSSKIISIGNTSFFNGSGITCSSDLGKTGFIIKRNNNCILINSYDSVGLVPAIRYLLEKTINFDVFSVANGDTCDYYDSLSSIVISNLNVEYIPTIGYRELVTSSDAVYGGLKMNMMYNYNNNGGLWLPGETHSMSDLYLSYDTYYSSHSNWYYKNGSEIQLCYCAHGNASEYEAMKQTLANEIIAQISATTEKNIYVNLSIRDNWSQCNCSACQAELTTYGGFAGQQLHFVSAVCDIVDNYVKNNNLDLNMNYVMLAYQQGQDPATVPTTYTLNKNIIVYFGAPKADYSKNFNSTENAEYYNQMLGWSNFMKALGYKQNLWFWAYSTPAMCYMLPFNDFEASASLIRTLNELGFCRVQYEFPYKGRTPCFEQLNIYMKGKLMTDVNIDYDAYVNKFMSNYYGPCLTNMKAYYNLIKSIAQSKYAGTIFTESNNKDYWSNENVSQMITYLEACISDVSSVADETLRATYEDRIHKEMCTPLFLLFEHYIYSHTYSKAQMKTYLSDFKSYLTKFGITLYSHNTAISEKTDTYDSKIKILAY